jgi:hypothetical protein
MSEILNYWENPIIHKGKWVTLIPLIEDQHEALAEAIRDGELWNLWYSRVQSTEGKKP